MLTRPLNLLLHGSRAQASKEMLRFYRGRGEEHCLHASCTKCQELSLQHCAISKGRPCLLNERFKRLTYDKEDSMMDSSMPCCPKHGKYPCFCDSAACTPAACSSSRSGIFWTMVVAPFSVELRITTVFSPCAISKGRPCLINELSLIHI